MLLPFALFAQLSLDVPPTAYRAALASVTRPGEHIVISDSLSHEFGPGVPVRRTLAMRLPQHVRADLSRAGHNLDGSCEGERCVFVSFHSARSDQSGDYVIRASAYRRMPPVSAETHSRVLNIRCDAASEGCIVRPGTLEGAGHIADVNISVETQCIDSPLPTDSSEASYHRRLCSFWKPWLGSRDARLRVDVLRIALAELQLRIDSARTTILATLVQDSSTSENRPLPRFGAEIDAFRNAFSTMQVVAHADTLFLCPAHSSLDREFGNCPPGRNEVVVQIGPFHVDASGLSVDVAVIQLAGIPGQSTRGLRLLFAPRTSPWEFVRIRDRWSS
jgi:hypothetical protein